jgi:hypothetical protein
MSSGNERSNVRDMLVYGLILWFQRLAMREERLAKRAGLFPARMGKRTAKQLEGKRLKTYELA